MAKKSANKGTKNSTKKQTVPEKAKLKTEPKKKEVSNSKDKIDEKPVKNEGVKRIGDGIFDVHHLIKLIPVVLILLVMLYAFFIRIGPENLNGLEDRVEANTYVQIQNLISQQVDAQYPDLNPMYKQELVDEQYQSVLDTGVFEYAGQRINVSDVAEQNAGYIKEAFKADNNQTYLNAIDPHHFYKLAENVVENGHQGDELRENANGELQPYVDYKLAPVGQFRAEKEEFHIWLIAKLFEMNGLDENSPVGEKTAAIYLIPVVFAMLSVIPAFLIIRKFSNDLFAVLGSLFLMSVSTFVSRTVAGFVDTDAYNVFFPLMIVMFVIYSFMTENRLLKYLYISLAGLFQGLYLWAWGPGWFIFVFVIASLLGYIGYVVALLFVEKFKNDKLKMSSINSLVMAGLFVLISAIATYLFADKNIFRHTYSGIVGGLKGVTSLAGNIWPNVFTSVAELNSASFAQIVSAVGGGVVFFLAMIALVFLSVDFKPLDDRSKLFKRLIVLFGVVWFVLFLGTKLFIPMTANLSLLFLVLLFVPVGMGIVLGIINRNESPKVFLLIMLSIWIAGTVYMSLNGVRFILLLAPAFAVAFALGLFYVGRIINEFFSKEFSLKSNLWKNFYGFLIAGILFIILFMVASQDINSNGRIDADEQGVSMLEYAISISKGTTPNFDDAWYGSMEKIKENSNESAIITSWWDFGHFFAMASDRGVTFDGGTQTTPRSHWVGKLLMENDEEASRDILRMLVCGGNTAFEYMLEESGDDTGGILVNKVIYSTLGVPMDEKADVLRNNKYFEFSDEQIAEIMSRLACENPPENFLITSEDMVGKAGVWAHWGSWDFTKKYVYDNYQRMSAEQIAENIDENVSLIEQYVTELNEIDLRARTEDVKRLDLVNQWFAPYPGYVPLQGRYLYDCAQSNNTLVCQNGVSIDLSTGEVNSQLNSQVTFRRAILPNAEGELAEFEINPQGDFDLVFVPSQTNYQVMLAQYPLGNSLFTKLFYYDGKFSNNYFEKFDDVNSVSGVRVITWKVNFDEPVADNSSSLEVSNVDFDVPLQEDLVNNS